MRCSGFTITPETFTGRGTDYLEFTRADYRTAQAANIARAFERGMTEAELRSGAPFPDDPKELCIVRPDGSEVFTLGDAIVIVDEDRKPLRMLGVTYDVTERKRAEEHLRQSEADLLEAERVAHVGHWKWEVRTNRVTWSAEMKRIWGFDPTDVKGDLSAVIEARIHPDDRAAVLASNEAVATGGAPATLEYRIVIPPPAPTTSTTCSAVIIGHVELALETLATGDRGCMPIWSRCRRPRERSADLTRQLLAFARQQVASRPRSST